MAKPKFQKNGKGPKKGDFLRFHSRIDKSNIENDFLVKLDESDKEKSLEELIESLTDKELYISKSSEKGMDAFSVYEEGAEGYEEYMASRNNFVKLFDSSKGYAYYLSADPSYGFYEHTDAVEERVNLGANEEYADKINVGNLIDRLASKDEVVKLGYNLRESDLGYLEGERDHKEKGRIASLEYDIRLIVGSDYLESTAT